MNNLPKVVTQQLRGRASNPRLLDRKSDALPLSHRATLQCDTWLWDDMPLDSPKRPPYWNSTSGFHFHTSPPSTCHSVPVCEILSKSDHSRQKKMTSCRFSRWRVSAILDCRDPIMGSLKSPVKLTYLPIGRQ